VVDVHTLQRHELRCSPALLEWLADEAVSLAVVAGGRLVVVSAAWTVGETAEIALDGVAAAAWEHDTLWVFDRWQLWRFVDALAESPDDGVRRFLLPQAGHTVGLVNASDLVMTSAGPLIASSLFGCLAVPDERWAFRAVWAPPWLTALRPEGRSGLSGVAVRDGLADAVTLTTKSDEAGSDDVHEGEGLVVSVAGEEIIGGLTAPRHPRWWRDTLLVAEGGSGRLLAVDPARHAVETVTELPGVAGGLAVYGTHAVLGCSAAGRGAAAGLPGGRLAAGATPRDGMCVVDLGRGTVIGEAWFAGHAGPVTSIAVIPDARTASIAEPRSAVSQSTVVVERAEGL
jgi:uncharacterized protein (TIGR03032 family)